MGVLHPDQSSEMKMKYPKKLIEVALPLDDINRESAREKAIRHGHPSSLHLWWARRPLATARAVLFAQLVNDPGGERGWGAYKGQTKDVAQRERERLFEIIRKLVKWENTTNEEVLEQARVEIRRSWAETCKLTGEDPNKLPPFWDPFSGGGSIPLEAQRLGLEAHASDLNPVAVMICKALIEIPTKFANRAPVGPIPECDRQTRSSGTQKWTGAAGLAEDVRRYGHWMRQAAFKRIGHLYPQVELPREYGGGKATVIAWIWARTVASPNPAYSNLHVPLISTFFLATKNGKQTWLKPDIDEERNTYRFKILRGQPENTEAIRAGTKFGAGSSFRCLMSGSAITSDYLKSEGKAGRMGKRLIAIVAEGKGGRVYLEADTEHEKIALSAQPAWKPNQKIEYTPPATCCIPYGLEHFGDLYTPRQLSALSTFSDLVIEVKQKVISDAKTAGWFEDSKGLGSGGKGTSAYAEAVQIYMQFALDKCSNYWSSLSRWRNDPKNEIVGDLFSMQAIPMIWDFAEGNPFSNSGGNLEKQVTYLAKALNMLDPRPGYAYQQDAIEQPKLGGLIISTDPPYYANIHYAPLSDCFYVWMRRSLMQTFPELFATMLVPKTQELVANAQRHGSKQNAERFFLNGLRKVFLNVEKSTHTGFPVTVYYAVKQSESHEHGISSKGWEVFLEAVLGAGFSITGTWPVRTELGNRIVSSGKNSLASSIVLVCRRRDPNSNVISRKQFIKELENALPEALETMIGGASSGVTPIAPVDLAQAAIGPGMAVYSQYAAVLEADGNPMPVRTALAEINKAIDEYFSRAESNMDAQTRFCLDWFQVYGFGEGSYGEADVLSRAKSTNIDGITSSNVLKTGRGKVRLSKVSEYDRNWDPRVTKNVSVWEACHRLSRALKESESVAGVLLSRMPEKTDSIRQLAYRLYSVCERKGWAEEALIYNELVSSWRSIVEISHQLRGSSGLQERLDF
jgi:putative DNA methylase